MRINNLEQFIKLRHELTQEKNQLAERLAQINEALGDLGGDIQPAAPTQASTPKTSAQTPKSSAGSPGRSPGRPAGGGTGGSLREHVLAVLKEGPKTKEEVLAAVQSRGYRFQTTNPLNSLGVILYGKNPKLNRVDGRFSLNGGAGSAKGGSSNAGADSSGGGKRQMSPAARARIAEAQRKRWAATRKDASKGQSSVQKNGASTPANSSGGNRKISAAGRKAIAEAARKRWAAARASGKNKL